MVYDSWGIQGLQEDRERGAIDTQMITSYRAMWVASTGGDGKVADYLRWLSIMWEQFRYASDGLTMAEELKRHYPENLINPMLREPFAYWMVSKMNGNL